jgi:hypothetical protein
MPSKMNATIEIFDPAMCCSTGVCGTDVDDTLADFANNLKWLKSRGMWKSRRFNLGQEPEVVQEQSSHPGTAAERGLRMCCR